MSYNEKADIKATLERIRRRLDEKSDDDFSLLAVLGRIEEACEILDLQL